MCVLTNQNQHMEFRYSPSLAASKLSAQLGGTYELWLARMANWRRPGRSTPLPHDTTEAGNPVYSHDALVAFIGDQTVKQALIAETRAASPVHAGAAAVLDRAAEAPHVRLAVTVPGIATSAFVVTASAARDLAEQLLKAASAVTAFSPSHAA